MLAVMREVMRHSGSEYYELVEELDLTLNQLCTLQVVQASGTLSLKELAELAHTSLPATSRNVEQLLQRGLLERREDAQDRRIKRVSMTPTGSRTLGKINGAKLAGLETFAATLTEQQRTRLRRALQGLVPTEEQEAAA
jgi:DNA-binding MarR family transcriptional regulator